MRILPALLRHTVQLQGYAGDSAYGPIYSPEISAPARVEFTSGVTQDREGQDTNYNARIFLFPEVDVQPEAIITYTDSYGRTYTLRAVSVSPQAGIDGSISHIEVQARYG